MTRIEERIGAALRRWVDGTRRRAGAVVSAIALATLVLGGFAATHLGINTDHKELLGPDVPFRQDWEAFAAHFPTLDDAILVVVDGETPELSREASRALSERMEARTDTFRDVFVPGAGPFFERNGLLYRSADELDSLADQIARVQPVIAELTRDPTVANLAGLIRTGLIEARAQGAEEQDWPTILERVGHATVEAYAEHPVQVSWEDVLLSGSALDPVTRRIIVAEPMLDFESLLPAGRSIGVIRELAAELGLDEASGVRVRLTGNPVLNHEEMHNLAWDVGYAGLFSTIFICGILYYALRSFRLMASAIVTLVVGLVWTSAFAGAAVGRLNLVSIAFAVLFVGLGIDFAIHLAMHYEETRRQGAEHVAALHESLARVGSSLAICTLTTAIGFFAFAPTDFRGVAELGIIAGGGMFVIFFLTVTLFPALLEVWVQRRADWPDKGGPMRLRALSTAEFHPRATVGIAALLAAVSFASLSGIRFEANVINFRDPDTESVQTFRELLADPETTPWQLDILTPDLEAAQEIAERVRALPTVEQAVTLADFVPDDQEEKIEILEDVAWMLDVPRGGGETPALSTEEQIAALRDLYQFLDRPDLVGDPSAFGGSARRLRDELRAFLERVEGDPRADDALASFEQILLGHLPDQLDRIRRATAPEPFGVDDLPQQVVRRMLAEDGSARVQIFPSENVGDTETLTRFVDEVRTITTRVTGVGANLVELSRATSASLLQAFSISLAAIAVLLWLLWRRVGEMVLVLTPLILGSVLIGGSMIAIGMPFTFINVIVLPLLLGVGVDSGVHLVHRGIHLAESAGAVETGLTGTVTARAVFYSAATTIMSFGSLAFSSHPGLAGLGTLLVIGMVLTLSSNLLVLPALIRLYRRRRRREGSDPA